MPSAGPAREKFGSRKGAKAMRCQITSDGEEAAVGEFTGLAKEDEGVEEFFDAVAVLLGVEQPRGEGSVTGPRSLNRG